MAVKPCWITVLNALAVGACRLTASIVNNELEEIFGKGGHGRGLLEASDRQGAWRSASNEVTVAIGRLAPKSRDPAAHGAKHEKSAKRCVSFIQERNRTEG